MSSSGGMGAEAIMYLYIIACLSSSLHCALVKGNPKDAAILTATHTKTHKYLQCLSQTKLPLLSLSLSLINEYQQEGKKKN